MPHPLPRPQTDPGPQPVRISWPDVFVIALTLGFIIFLTMYLDIPVQAAAAIGVTTVAATLMILFTPKAVVQIIGLLREIRSLVAAGGGTHG